MGLTRAPGRNLRWMTPALPSGARPKLGLVGEMRVGEFLVLLGAILFGYSLGALEGHRHAKR
jgi:hypothetical protein